MTHLSLTPEPDMSDEVRPRLESAERAGQDPHFKADKPSRQRCGFKDANLAQSLISAKSVGRMSHEIRPTIIQHLVSA